jgi:SAM-dependent MidA family methyltransferase
MHIIEKQQLFSQSLIWQLQRDYFSSAGIDAWRSGEVPHYITSNPVVGKTYAELVLAFLRDLSLRGQREETVYLLELGAGHGRLCYHFFKHFEKYYTESAIALPPFCYILSDFTAANLAFWQDHPRLQPYLGNGWLDFALFDVENSSDLSLQYAGVTIQQQALSQPLIIMANYFFDTIPQDLFLIENQAIAHGLLSLATAADPSELDTAELIEGLELKYDYEEAKPPIYADEPILNDMLAKYRQQLEHTHLLLPHLGLRCLERLRQLSRQGLVLLSADKGEHHLSNLDDRPAPQLATHGSFSLTVNYHALGQYCTRHGGLALLPRHQQASLDLGCLLFLDDAPTYRETLNAYERFVGDFGPDDYFSLKKLIEQHYETLNDRDIMAVIRLSGYDARIFSQMLPRLFDLLPTLADNQRWNLFLAIPRIWDTYYPLGEPDDLAFDLGDLLLALAFYQEAILYYEKSVMIYGKDADTLSKSALCHCLLGAFSTAAPIIEELRAYDPDNEALLDLIQGFGKELIEK